MAAGRAQRPTSCTPPPRHAPASAARPPSATAGCRVQSVSAFAEAYFHYNTVGSFLCHARDDSAYFWGADKKPAGDQFLVETARNAIGLWTSSTLLVWLLCLSTEVPPFWLRALTKRTATALRWRRPPFFLRCLDWFTHLNRAHAAGKPLANGSLPTFLAGGCLPP